MYHFFFSFDRVFLVFYSLQFHIMTYKEILLHAKKEISSLDANILASFVFGLSDVELITKGSESPPENLEKQFWEYIKKRKNGHSVSELIGKRDFYGLSFLVTNDVLTPRPETEFLVDFALKHAVSFSRLIDIGTGSGCISLSFLSKNIKNVLAVDISKKALNVATKNVQSLLSPESQKYIELRESDLFSAIFPEELQNACIVANLPYIPENDILMPEVIFGDPSLALFSGEDGLDLYRRFFSELPDVFYVCAFEFHPPQKPFLESFITEKFPKRNIMFHSDLSGDVRFGSII